MKYDVIIVGAGPAGSSAAYLLASAGMRALLLDRAEFPRNKLCGGMLSGRSQRLFTEIFGASWSPTIEYIAHGIAMYHGQTLLNSLEDARPLHFTSRSVFDAFLVELAERQGATLRQRATVRGVDPKTNAVYLEGGEELRADFVIGADGALSRVARSLRPAPLDRRRLAFALEIEAPRHAANTDVTIPEIYFGVVNWGYAWVFPKSETLTVGAGGVWQKNPQLISVFREFLRQRFGASLDMPLKGHYLPFCRYRRAPGRGAALLVGDAAGLVEPITGEGIAFAMQSGQFAAEAILEAAKQGDPARAYAHYRRAYRHFTGMFDLAHLRCYCLFPRPMEALFAKTLPTSPRLLARQMDLLADDIDYPEFFRLVLAGLARRGWRALRGQLFSEV